MNLFLILYLALGVNSTSSSSLLEDRELQQGFRLSALRSSLSPVEIGDILVVEPGSSGPKWRLAQWGSRFSLETATPEILPDGSRRLSNEGKTVIVSPGGLAGEGVLLEVKGGAEYGGKLRRQGQAWPHLLVEQKLDSIGLKSFGAIHFGVEFRVEYCKPATEKPMDPGLHTAHINAYFTIHNGNPAKADYRDMIWFGLPLFDARYPIPPGHQALDGGQEDTTGKFICTMEGNRFYKGPVDVGAWHTLSCDMVPLVGEALLAAQSHGYLKNTTLEDLTLTSFNLGWEVPGTYDCSIRLRHLKLETKEQ